MSSSLDPEVPQLVPFGHQRRPPIPLLSMTGVDFAHLTAFGVHPYLQYFPLLPETQLIGLTDDIAYRGLLQKIDVCRNQIIDGRCRLLACVQAGVKPKFTIRDNLPEPSVIELIKFRNRNRLPRTVPVHQLNRRPLFHHVAVKRINAVLRHDDQVLLKAQSMDARQLHGDYYIQFKPTRLALKNCVDVEMLAYELGVVASDEMFYQQFPTYDLPPVA